MSDAILDTIIVTLIQSRLDRGEEIFSFSSGSLRGKVTSVDVKYCLPSATYLGSSYDVNNPPMEMCISLVYIPGPRDRNKSVDPLTVNYTRKPVIFNVPLKAEAGLFLQKIEDKVWMLNINTAFKG